MKLEQEAKDFMMGKRKEFTEALVGAAADMEDFVLDNIYESRERSLALTKLKVFELWAIEAAKRHGIK